MQNMQFDLDALIENEEIEEIEAKAAQGRDGGGAIPESLWETYSSFANSHGGYIILGAEEKPDGRFVFTGITQPEKLWT